MRNKKTIVVSTVLGILIVLLFPINVQVFAIETDNPLPPIERLGINFVSVSNFQLSNFKWRASDNHTIQAAQVDFSMQVKNLSGVYRIYFELLAENVTLTYRDAGGEGSYHFDTLVLKGYADLNEKAVTVQAFKPMRIVDLLWGL